MICNWGGCKETAVKKCEVELMSGKTVSAGYCELHVATHRAQCHEGTVSDL